MGQMEDWKLFHHSQDMERAIPLFEAILLATSRYKIELDLLIDSKHCAHLRLRIGVAFTLIKFKFARKSSHAFCLLAVQRKLLSSSIEWQRAQKPYCSIQLFCFVLFLSFHFVCSDLYALASRLIRLVAQRKFVHKYIIATPFGQDIESQSYHFGATYSSLLSREILSNGLDFFPPLVTLVNREENIAT